MKDFPLPLGIKMVAYLNDLDDDGKVRKEPDAWQFRDVTLVECAERMKKSRPDKIGDPAPLDTPTGKYRVTVRTERGHMKALSIRSLHIRVSVLSPHGGPLVAKHMRLVDAAETPYSAKPLWWQDKDFVRIASELEVHLFLQGFRPKPGWKLVDFNDGSEIEAPKRRRGFWPLPVRAMMTLDEKKAARVEKASDEIKGLEARRRELKKQIRTLSEEATAIRLKLAILKRVR